MLRGDRRALYLGWLLRAQTEELDNEDFEPPVPDGLNALSASLTQLANFLRIDQDLLAVAAQSSASELATNTGLAEWIAALPLGEKEQLLIEAVEGKDPLLGANESVRFKSRFTTFAGQYSNRPSLRRRLAGAGL